MIKSFEKFNQQDNNSKLLYNKYPVIIGDFTLTKKPSEDNSIYTYINKVFVYGNNNNIMLLKKDY